ncbi:hypothetical protein [Methylovulum psychrotolerans]|uniref:Uncharacterized protein n=1 Tax=Methylovulum psychrotolerans TaxID=1704499 RepID=A0A2S5CGQ3_9GAMM|nr:hypothetical protein [Methylovulum psychrotolerans]POZ49990.1 hypothetical protein AADEFJLK_04197 [Methylovulum psychrotolerans]
MPIPTLTKPSRYFTDSHFLPKPAISLPDGPRLQLIAAEALYYFFSNQTEKISDRHHKGIKTLFAAAKKNSGALMVPATVLTASEAMQAENLAVSKPRLARLLGQCRHEHFAEQCVATALTSNLSLMSPFSDNRASCQESYEADGMNYLRFTDGQQCFFVLQGVSSADSLYFPEGNSLICLVQATASEVRHLQNHLLGEFHKVLAYAQGSNKLAGLIASHSLPEHFYYEILPALLTVYQNPQLRPHIPGLVMRKGQDFIDLKLLFPNCPSSVLGAGEMSRQAFSTQRWFIHIGNAPQQRSLYKYYDAVNRYLFKQINNHVSHEAQAKAVQMEDCYPLIWIGVAGQKNAWQEQVDGYSYILNQLIARYPRLGVIIDGRILAASAKKAHRTADYRLAEAIRKRLHPDILTLSVIDENTTTKLFIAANIDFFIGSFATGSLYVSGLLSKPGIAHLGNAEARQALEETLYNHPNPNVYLLPKAYVKDKRAGSVLKTLWKKSMAMSLKTAQQPASIIIEHPYSIEKKAFYRYIEARLDKVLLNPQNTKIRFFIEPSFSINPAVRHYLTMASHGNLLEVFPTLPFPKNLTDLAEFSETYLKQHIIYGLFTFGSQQILNRPSEFMVWLGDPLRRVQQHILLFAKNAERMHQACDMATILKAEHKSLDNYYTRLISGLDAPFGKCTETMLNTALGNMAQYFVFIGINEQQKLSFDRLCTLMDWERSLFPDSLPNTQAIDTDAFSEDHLEQLNALCVFDYRLYKAALAMARGAVL